MFLEEEFKARVTGFNTLTSQTKFTRQKICNMWMRFKSDKSILKDYRNQNQRNKLSEAHCRRASLD